MMRSNVHTHSTWCDGSETPHGLAEAALALGFTDLGFSSHAPAPFDPCCPGLAEEAPYLADIAAVKREYAGRLGVLCGIEMDTFATVEREKYDYIILSNHYLPGPAGERYSVDDTPEKLRQLIDVLFGGETDKMPTTYYNQTAESVLRFRPDIVGHFDLLVKYNRGNVLFNEDSRAYKQAALEAMDQVLDVLEGYGGMVEVNTGAMARRHRDVPYPAPFLLRHMAQRGARAIITTDCHHADLLSFGYETAAALLREAGFTAMAELRQGKFVDVKL